MALPTFLNLVQNDVCHPQAIHTEGSVLYCRLCQKSVMNAYEYINRPMSGDYFRSSQLAQAFAQWTGDLHVPMSFPLSHIEGIFDRVVVGQPLSRVMKSIRLLRALNGPFTTMEETAAANPPDGESFLADFLDIIHQHSPQGNEHEALQALLEGMHEMVSAKVNPFETYFKVMVPYVKRCQTQRWQPFPVQDPHSNLAMELHTQLIRSFQIRQTFGRYALPFDVLHVMVACYACSCSMETVGNWAMDFLIRICRGHFFWDRQCPFVHAMQRLVDRKINYHTNAHYYQKVIRWFLSGETIDQYSEMWYPLLEVQTFLKRHYSVPHTTPDMLEMGFLQTFPATLFQNCPDQLGFTMAYNHLFMSMNHRTGQLPKGAFKKAKQIHGLVRRFVEKICEFDAGKSTPIWDLEMVKLFFLSDPNFQDEIMEVIHLLMKPESEEKMNVE